MTLPCLASASSSLSEIREKLTYVWGGKWPCFIEFPFLRLASALFVLLLSTLVCCQPTELIWAFFLFCFINCNLTSGGGTLQRLARACSCFCVFVVWLLSSFSVGCSCFYCCLFFVWSFRLFGSWLVPLRQYSSSKFPSFYEWWDAVLQKRLAWALFVLLLSTLVCCQPTELILVWFFSNFTPPPPQIAKCLSECSLEELMTPKSLSVSRSSGDWGSFFCWESMVNCNCLMAVLSCLTYFTHFPMLQPGVCFVVLTLDWVFPLCLPTKLILGFLFAC